MTIVITLPKIIDGEAGYITRLLHRHDIDLLHLRKPGSTIEDVERLLKQIPQELHRLIVVHDHFLLAERYRLHGVHLNSRNPTPPSGWRGSVSRSCHSLEEVNTWKPQCDYVSLSPIFDSISKQGYLSAFTKEEISQAVKDSIIDSKVLALGGVTFARLDDVKLMGFGGGMILGDAWRELVQ